MMPTAARKAAHNANATRLDVVEAQNAEILERLAAIESRLVGIEPKPALDAAARRRTREEAQRAIDTEHLKVSAARTAAETAARNARAKAKQAAVSEKGQQLLEQRARDMASEVARLRQHALAAAPRLDLSHAERLAAKAARKAATRAAANGQSTHTHQPQPPRGDRYSHGGQLGK